ncbi:MAG TPA: hypothetical protein VFQ44_00540 [Streptosporangiaceae bacterium]|nr:hypothetical protein [Streptosporangiaceae bacterium]
MDYSELNLSSWSTYLIRFKDLLRPEGVAPLGAADEDVESARGEDAAKVSLSVITGRLPNLVFDGYRDWYSYEDDWVLRNLGQVLTPAEEDEILRRLDDGTPQALGELLDYIASQRLEAWEAAARDEFARADGDGAAELLTGLPNTANWQASRTPGTYYYTYVGGRYLYSDLAEGTVSEWETLRDREQLASANAEPWGDSGWYCSPTGEPELYDGAYVYAPERDGPWMTEELALAEIAAAAEPSRYEPVEAVPGEQGWLRGYDTQEKVWKFTRGSERDIPGDEAWTAVDTVSLDGSMYFVGPGYSDSGWLPYEAFDEEPARAAAEEAKAADAAIVRQEIVRPGIQRLMAAHPGLSEAQAEETIVRAALQVFQRQ